MNKTLYESNRGYMHKLIFEILLLVCRKVYVRHMTRYKTIKSDNDFKENQTFNKQEEINNQMKTQHK